MKELFYQQPAQQINAELNELNKATLKSPLKGTDYTINGISVINETGLREVSLKATEGSRFYGTVKNPGVKYTRYILNKLFVQPPVVYVPGEITLKEALLILAEQYNLPPFTFASTDQDIGEGPVDFPFDYSERIILKDKAVGAKEVIEIEPTPISIGYMGTINVTFINRGVSLDKIITERGLNGLTYPDATEGKIGSLSLLTWPVEYKLSRADLNRLCLVGSELKGYDEDTLSKDIVDSILNYYREGLEDEVGFKSKLVQEVSGLKVTETNLDAEGNPTGVEGATPYVTLEKPNNTSTNWKGKVIIRIVNFY